MNYLYNGIELPELPEWDKETYPYVFMYVINYLGKYLATLYCFSEPHHLTVPNDKGVYAIGVFLGEKYLTGGFSELTEETGTDPNGHRITTSPHWANYDILNNDGTLYLAASDPIPVGSAPELEPKSFMAGWRMGQFVRGMRG